MFGSYLSQLLSSSRYLPVHSHDDTEKTQVVDRPFRRPLFVFSVTFLATTIFCLSIVSILPASRTTSTWNSSPGDIIPKGTPISTTFTESYQYQDPHSKEADEIWRRMEQFQGIRGIPIQQPERHGLKPGYPSNEDPNVKVYLPSFHHQLHCLVNIRNHYYQLGSPAASNRRSALSELHVEHCFDYLRQALLCYGDTTLEWPMEYPDGRVLNADGLGISHQCRDIDSAQEYLSDHSVGFHTISNGTTVHHNSTG